MLLNQAICLLAQETIPVRANQTQNAWLDRTSISQDLFPSFIGKHIIPDSFCDSFDKQRSAVLQDTYVTEKNAVLWGKVHS